MRALLVFPLAVAIAVAGAPLALAADGDTSAEPTPPAAPAKPDPKTRASARRGKRAHKAEPPANAPVATYPGFRMLETGASFVWLEVSRRVEVVETKTPIRLVYRLKGAITRSKNNLRPLVTNFFHSPVDRVQLVESDEDLDLVIEVRDSGDAKARIVETEGGMMLRVDFPKVARPRDPAASAAKAPATRPSETKRILDEQP